MKASILLYLDERPPAREIFNGLISAGDIYLIGGVLREYKDHHSINDLRDIDIIVDVKNYHNWDDTIRRYSIKTNRFGGSTLSCDDLIVDTWPLEQTWAYKQNLICCDPVNYFKMLTKTVFLNIDGIVYDWQREIWNEEEYQCAMKLRVLDVVLPQNPLLCLNILRTFILQDRYQMKLSERLKQIILAEYNKAYSHSDFVDSLMAEQLRRYGKELVSRQGIEKKIHELNK